MIGHNLGHYRILDGLGAGGMGGKCLSEDSELDSRRWFLSTDRVPA